MRGRWRRAVRRRPFLVELFATFNLAFLAIDIYLAHSVNAFREPAEWVPFAFTLAAALALAVNLVASAPVRPDTGVVRDFREGAGRWVGVVVGGVGIAVGVAGLLFHLNSDFFQALTLRALVYSAPFVAPLAFTGLGLLLLVNRLVPTGSLEWGQWVLWLAWAGFFGNFALSLVDHAQNGFFYRAEWVPVGVAAMVVGGAGVPIFLRTPRRFFTMAAALLGLAAVTGVVGFFLHLWPAITGVEATLRYRVIYGPPLFAPLLFPNLALLAAVGLWDLFAKGWTTEAAPAPDSEPEPA